MDTARVFWQKWWWGTLILFSIGLIILTTINSKVFSPDEKNFEEGQQEVKGSTEKSSVPSPTPTSTPTPTPVEVTPTPSPADISPSPIPTATPTPTPLPTKTPTISFDKTLGNNYIAAKEAERMSDVLSNASPGFINSVRIELSPEEIRGSEAEYKAKLTSVYLYVEVDPGLWSTTPESLQKDLAVMFLNAITDTFVGGIQHVRINNGIRKVADADWSFFGDKANVKLY